MADHIISMKSKVKWECYCDINVVVISFKLYLHYLTIAIATNIVVKIAEQHAELLCLLRWQPSINFLETIIITQPVLKQSISSCFTTIWSAVMDDCWMRSIGSCKQYRDKYVRVAKLVDYNGKAHRPIILVLTLFHIGDVKKHFSF